MSMEKLEPDAPEEEILLQAVARLNARLLGGALGVTGGLILFIATIVLVLKDGPNPGPHLALLSQYFPGYSVTVVGAFVGFAYGLVVGYVAGWIIGVVYNRVVSIREAPL
jgi:hypothetical protein